jgi:hypothetical protein
MIPGGMGLVAQWLSRLHRMWEDAGSNPVGPILLALQQLQVWNRQQ